MPILRYFIAVGTVLTFGLFALNAYLEPVPANAPMRVSITPTTASLHYLAPAPKKASPDSN
jgi:hypothetical protein